MFFNLKIRNLAIPHELQQYIKQQTVELAYSKQQYILSFIHDLAINHQIIPELSFVWETYYGNDHKPSCNLDETCRNVPLHRSNCKCKLSYSIVRCYINLDTYELLTLPYKNEMLELSAPLILDYGLLYQILFFDLDQTDLFG